MGLDRILQRGRGGPLFFFVDELGEVKMTLMSFRAECMYDVEIAETLIRDGLGEDVHFTQLLPDGNIPDVVVEMEVNAFLEDVIEVLRVGPDLHVICDTLEELPIDQNPMERKYK